MSLTLCLTILVASLAGSLHCAGMCGPFVLLACGTQKATPGVSGPNCGSKRSLLLGYHAGRGVTYLLWGLLAGTFGQLVNQATGAWGWQQVAAYAAGLLLIGMGAASVLRLSGITLPHLFGHQLVSRLLQGCFRRTAHWTGLTKATAIGFLTTWLPCGWLYAFVVVAGGSGSAWNAALVMLSFWAGTLPMLTLFAVGSRWNWAPWRTALPWVTASLMLLSGTELLLNRATAQMPVGNMSASAMSASSTSMDPKQTGQASPLGTAGNTKSLVDQVRDASETIPACCRCKARKSIDSTN